MHITVSSCSVSEQAVGPTGVSIACSIERVYSGGVDESGVPPARDPEFAARYLARDGLMLGPVSMPVPVGLASLAPGPQLAVVLAQVDPARVHRGHLADLIVAHRRVGSFEFAAELVAVWEWARTPVADGGTVVRMDEPHRYAARELAPLLACTLYRAEQLLTMARLAVHVAPALLAALRVGRLDRERLEVIAAELKAITDERAIRAVVDVLLGDVDTHTTGTLAERVRRVLGELDPQSVRKSREQRLHARRVVRRDAPGGVSRLVLGGYDAAAAAAAFEHIDAIAHATHRCGDPSARSLDQLRADIAIDLLRGVDPQQAGYSQPGQRHGAITLTVGLSTLAGLDDDAGVLSGYGPVTAAVARQTAVQFAGTCQWRFGLCDDEGSLLAEGPLPRGAVRALVATLRGWAAGPQSRHPVDHTAGPDGRAHREPTRAQKAFVRARDKTCQFPGCRVPAHRCDIDHRVAWLDAGPTVVANLYAVCRAHHRFKHLYEISYEPAVGGLVWNLPGQRYLKQRHHQTRPPTPVRVTSGLCDLTGYTHTGGSPPHLRQ
jgi:hypothetical protein